MKNVTIVLDSGSFCLILTKDIAKIIIGNTESKWLSDEERNQKSVTHQILESIFQDIPQESVSQFYIHLDLKFWNFTKYATRKVELLQSKNRTQ